MQVFHKSISLGRPSIPSPPYMSIMKPLAEGDAFSLRFLCDAEDSKTVVSFGKSFDGAGNGRCGLIFIDKSEFCGDIVQNIVCQRV